MSDNAATDGGRWRSAHSDDAGRGECWRRVSGRVQLLVVGKTRRAYCVVKRFCCIVDGVVVVVAVEERRFARAIMVGAGADASGGRTAELLKVDASGRGVMTSRPPGRGAVRRRGECWSVAVLVAEENVNARRWGMTCQAVLLMVVAVEERGVQTMLQIEGVYVGADASTTGETAEPC